MERGIEKPGLVISNVHVFLTVPFSGDTSVYFPLSKHSEWFMLLSNSWGVLIIAIKAVRAYTDLGVFETTLHMMTWSRNWEFWTCLERNNWAFKLLIQFIRKKQKQSYWCPTCSLCCEFMIIQNSAISGETQLGFTQLLPTLQRQTALLCQDSSEFPPVSGKFREQDTGVSV